MRPGTYYDMVTKREDQSDADNVISACYHANRDKSVNRRTVYDTLRAICRKEASHLEVMQTCFAVLFSFPHYDAKAQHAEFYTPKSNAEMYPPFVRIMFVLHDDTNVLREFRNKVLLGHNISRMLSWSQCTPGLDGRKKAGPSDNRQFEQYAAAHDNRICKGCMRYLAEHEPCFKLIPQNGDEQTHIVKNVWFDGQDKPMSVHVPPPRMSVLSKIRDDYIAHKDQLFPLSVFAQPPLEDLLELVYGMTPGFLWLINVVWSHTRCSSPLLWLYGTLLGLRTMRGDDESVRVYWSLVSLGLFGNSGGMPWDEAKKRCSTIYGLQSEMVRLFITGQYTLEDARKAINRTTTPGVELLSIMSTDPNTFWILHNFSGSTVQLNDESHIRMLYDRKLFVFKKSTACGEHACCSRLQGIYIKWQPLFAFEIATISPWAGGGVDTPIAAAIAALAPTHSVTLLEKDCSIGREYANYNKMASQPDFFVLPVLACVTPTTKLLETSNNKRSPETFLHTTFAEFTLVTVYVDFGVTLQKFLELSIFQHPFKAVLNLCLLFIARYRATEFLWPDMHDRNLTVRILNKPTTLHAGDGLSLTFEAGEQVICAIDHGDDTISRGVLNIDTQRDACRTFMHTVRTIINKHNMDFNISRPLSSQEVDFNTLTVLYNQPLAAALCVFRQIGSAVNNNIYDTNNFQPYYYNTIIDEFEKQAGKKQPFEFQDDNVYPLQQALVIWRDVKEYTIDAIEKATRELMPLLKPSFFFKPSKV